MHQTSLDNEQLTEILSKHEKVWATQQKLAFTMSLRRKITAAVILTIFSVVSYFGYKIVYTVRHIPEAYAAWDTGTLLVEYMKSHDARWPSSWDDLLSVMSSNSGDQIMFRGAVAGDTNYTFSLRKKVIIDWKFDSVRNDKNSPVMRPDGTKFPVVWRGAEPNEMIRAYLKTRTATNAPQPR